MEAAKPREKTVDQISMEIMRELFHKRRLLPGEEEREEDFTEEAAPHMHKIMEAVSQGNPIEMILPAFPAKSPNRRKTLGPLPDHGEDVAFANLDKLCRRIQSIYEPGARLTICSDGRVFADVVHIPDKDVTDYNRELKSRFSERYADWISFYDLDDAYNGFENFALLREELMISFGEPIKSLRHRCKAEKEAGAMYRGIVRFMVEDYSGLAEFSEYSRNAIQNYARTAAYRVIQRSNAWGRLLADRFADSIRLSIHPQYRVSQKIGVFLVETEDCWATPWHSVAFKEADRVTLLPRHEAERRDAVLVFENGRPSYFQQMTHAHMSGMNV